MISLYYLITHSFNYCINTGSAVNNHSSLNKNISANNQSTPVLQLLYNVLNGIIGNRNLFSFKDCLSFK